MLTWASVLSPEPAVSHLLDYTLVVNANNALPIGTVTGNLAAAT